MNPGITKLGKIFADTNTYRVPRYQRPYQWHELQWQGIVRDVFLASSAPQDHFLGILLLAPSSTTPVGPSRVGRGDFDVIDGQQRLVTILVWAAALTDHAGTARETLAAVEVSVPDQAPYKDVIDGLWESRVSARSDLTGPLAAYHYFRWVLWLGGDALSAAEPIPAPVPRVARWWKSTDYRDLFGDYRARQAVRDPEFPVIGKPPDIPTLLKTTFERLGVLDLTWDQRIDEPQSVIFEALNGMRVELQQLDHVRNRLFIRLSRSAAERAFEDHWQPTELRLQRTSHSGLRADPGSQFLYDYLISEGEQSVNRQRSAAQFERFSTRRRLRGKVELIQDHVVPAMGCWIAVVTSADEIQFGKTPPRRVPPDSAARIRSIRSFSISSDPLLLRLTMLWLKGRLDDKGLAECLTYLDSYWARHMMAGTNLSPYRAKFMGYMRSLASMKGGLDSLDAIRVGDVLRPDTPADATIKAGIPTLQAYGRLRSSQLMALLRGIEAGPTSGGAHPLPIGNGPSDFTVEHIAPQELRQWKADIGRWGIAQSAFEGLKHTLGNLTAATNTHNKSVGTKPLSRKQARLASEPRLHLNSSWQSRRRWTPTQIRERSLSLASRGLQYWKAF